MRRIAALLSAAIVLAAPVHAHSKKQNTVPADGATVPASPDQIEMQFDLPILITLFKIVDASGVEQDYDRTDGLVPVTDFEVIPKPLTSGSYSVEWRGLSSDGHPVEGSFSFSVK